MAKPSVTTCNPFEITLISAISALLAALLWFSTHNQITILVVAIFVVGARYGMLKRRPKLSA